MNGNPCGDCGVKPGEPHTDGCDVARCLVTGRQRLSCDAGTAVFGWPEKYPHDDCGNQVWTGEWTGIAECEEFGWWHERTEAEMATYREWGMPEPSRRTQDLNRLGVFSGQAEWDPVACRFRRRGDPVDDLAYVRWHLDRGLFLEPSARYTIEGVTLPAAEVLAGMTGEAGSGT